MNRSLFIFLILLASCDSPDAVVTDTIFCTHNVVLDNEGKIIPWFTPRENAYDHFLRLRWDFIKDRVPLSPGPDPRSRYPQYYFYCAFRNNNGILEPDTWMNDIGEKIPNWFENARLYYAYTADTSVMQLVKDFIDYVLVHGTSPETFAWPGFPYTTANAGDTVFRGFTDAGRFVQHEIQVDHAGEMGLTYYRMYLFSNEEKYLMAALNVANVLADKIKKGSYEQSIWPYRVVMDDGRITAPYGANWTGCYMLFDNLIRDSIGNVNKYLDVREKIRDFLLQYPLRTGYWTDGHTDTDIKSNTYKSNLSASNMTLCMFDYPELDPEWERDIPRLIKWTEDNFVFRTSPGEPSTMWGANIVGEQDTFNYKMDYQTARYAATCARWYSVSKDESYREKAYRSLNWVTYCNDSLGMAFESPVSKGILSWWSDCYGECPRMFYHVFAAVPEWAPPGEDHILYSEGILREVCYSKNSVKYIAARPGTEYLRLSFKPLYVTLNGELIPNNNNLVTDTYSVRSLGKGDYVITIKHSKNCEVIISTIAQPSQTKMEIDAGTRYQFIDGFGVNINPAWWLNGEYRDASVVKPAIDILIDSLGASIFRVVIEEIDWEEVNDDNDPENFNWTYFNRVFSNSRFQGVWSTLHYLNQRGIEDGLIISFMGAPPASEPQTEPDPLKSWMGDINFSINPAMEDELVESMAALLYYARNTEKINFRLVSPMNETDIVSSTKSPEHPDGIVEGPDMPDAEQYVGVIRKLAEKLDRIGMADIRFVAPDAAGDKLFSACFNEILKDPYLLGKMACWGVHQYGNDAENYFNIIRKHDNPVKTYWVTETAGIKNLLGQLDDSASVHIFWDGFDCVYQHGIRNGYGTNPPNDWVYWEGEQGKPLLAFNVSDQSWTPRKQFYEFSQLFRFVKPGAVRVGSFADNDSLIVYAFLNPNGQLVIFGKNNSSYPVSVSGIINDLPSVQRLRAFITNSYVNLQHQKDIEVSNNSWSFAIPAGTIFTLAGFPEKKQDLIPGSRPEPSGWYAGDIHVHRNCGEVTSIWPETSLVEMMETNDLSVVSLLADMGNGEVKDSKSDLPKVTGRDTEQSSPGRIVHWDAEWHFDPQGVTFENKALGGHIVLLGLKNATKIWEESPYKILEWGRKQESIMGFCHMQYLNDSIQSQLNCCIPVDFPVEIALGTIDFLSEDVWLNDASVRAYYKVLNCGFSPGWAAGTDFPCNNSSPLGSLLTYVQVNDEPLTYRKWIEGIKEGRTVITTNGHVEFLDLKVNGSSSPGDEINLRRKGQVNVNVKWTSILHQEGSIEIICNGKIVAKQDAIAGPGKAVTLNFDLPVGESSWICARRMNSEGHQSHTAPVYVTIRNKPVRASAEDAEYFVRWIENILMNIENNGPWSIYFTKDIETVKARYREAANIYRKIAEEAGKYHN